MESHVHIAGGFVSTAHFHVLITDGTGRPDLGCMFRLGCSGLRVVDIGALILGEGEWGVFEARRDDRSTDLQRLGH